MNKYTWFFIGYLTALATIFMASCTVTPLEAHSDELGSSIYNPLYVKIVE